jgi:hypothetical protein
VPRGQRDGTLRPYFRFSKLKANNIKYKSISLLGHWIKPIDIKMINSGKNRKT